MGHTTFVFCDFLENRFSGHSTLQRFTISEVAADWHEPMVPQRIMRPCFARANGQHSTFVLSTVEMLSSYSGKLYSTQLATTCFMLQRLQEVSELWTLTFGMTRQPWSQRNGRGLRWQPAVSARGGITPVGLCGSNRATEGNVSRVTWPTVWSLRHSLDSRHLPADQSDATDNRLHS